MPVLYGHVNGPADIRKINEKIREELKKALEQRRRAKVVELKRRSRYLIVLTYSPVWKKRFGKKITQIRRVAKREYKKTLKMIKKVYPDLGKE